MPRPATENARAMADAYHAGDMQRVLVLGAQAGEDADDTVLVLLALAQQATGHHGPAVASFRRLAQRRPDVSAYWNNLGVACRQHGDLDDAGQALAMARSLAPDDPDVLYNLGLLQIQQRRWMLARDTLLDAAQRSPGSVDIRLQAAYACFVCADTVQQEAMLADAGDWPGQPAEQALILASMLSAQGALDAALDTLARAQWPGGADDPSMRVRIAAQRVLIYERNNQLERARHAVQQVPLAALDALPADATLARTDGWRAHAALAMRSGAWADAATLYERVLALADDDETRAHAGFGLAAARERLHRPADAWRALQIAHAAQQDIARQVVPDLLLPDSQPLQMIGEVDRAAYARWSPLESPSSRQCPVFVVGFPRSGTTLLEQMLDAHPQFQSMDERAFVHELIERMEGVGQDYPSYLQAMTQEEADQLRALYLRMVDRVLPQRGSRQLVDKNPLNMLCLPMIMRLFPQARIVLCLRHPCDVLLSCFMQPFRSPAFMALCSSLQRLAHGYVQAFEQWHRHMTVFEPRVLEWRYESVVDRLDDQLARLGAFLDVADVSPMARFADHARAKRFISTPSYSQVTQRVHAGSVGRWQRYRESFEPVLPLLQPLIERLGYARDVPSHLT